MSFLTVQELELRVNKPFVYCVVLDNLCIQYRGKVLITGVRSIQASQGNTGSYIVRVVTFLFDTFGTFEESFCIETQEGFKNNHFMFDSEDEALSFIKTLSTNQEENLKFVENYVSTEEINQT